MSNQYPGNPEDYRGSATDTALQIGIPLALLAGTAGGGLMLGGGKKLLKSLKSKLSKGAPASATKVLDKAKVVDRAVDDVRGAAYDKLVKEAPRPGLAGARKTQDEATKVLDRSKVPMAPMPGTGPTKAPIQSKVTKDAVPSSEDVTNALPNQVVPSSDGTKILLDSPNKPVQGVPLDAKKRGRLVPQAPIDLDPLSTGPALRKSGPKVVDLPNSINQGSIASPRSNTMVSGKPSIDPSAQALAKPSTLSKAQQASGAHKRNAKPVDAPGEIPQAPVNTALPPQPHPKTRILTQEAPQINNGTSMGGASPRSGGLVTQVTRELPSPSQAPTQVATNPAAAASTKVSPNKGVAGTQVVPSAPEQGTVVSGILQPKGVAPTPGTPVSQDNIMAKRFGSNVPNSPFQAYSSEKVKQLSALPTKVKRTPLKKPLSSWNLQADRAARGNSAPVSATGITPVAPRQALPNQASSALGQQPGMMQSQNLNTANLSKNQNQAVKTNMNTSLPEQTSMTKSSSSREVMSALEMIKAAMSLKIPKVPGVSAAPKVKIPSVKQNIAPKGLNLPNQGPSTLGNNAVPNAPNAPNANMLPTANSYNMSPTPTPAQSAQVAQAPQPTTTKIGSVQKSAAFDLAATLLQTHQKERRSKNKKLKHYLFEMSKKASWYGGGIGTGSGDNVVSVPVPPELMTDREPSPLSSSYEENKEQGQSVITQHRKGTNVNKSIVRPDSSAWASTLLTNTFLAGTKKDPEPPQQEGVPQLVDTEMNESSYASQIPVGYA